MADAVDVLVKQLKDAGVPLDVARFSPPSLRIRYASAFRVTVEWIQPYVNTPNESRLIVAEWKGADASRVVHRNEEPLDQKTFFFDVAPEGDYAWRDEFNEFFSDVRLADWCVTRLLKRGTPETI